MTQKPLVSIVLPTYNGARYLSQSIQSCLDQTYTNWELIIVDDCSTDETPAVIAEYAVSDERICTIRHETNKRLPGALNTGFEAARGDYFTWTSDDNTYRPAALDEMVTFMETHPDVGMVYTDATAIDENGDVISEFSAGKPQMLVYKACVGACFLYRREVRDVVGDYEETLFCAEDYDYWLRISAHFRMEPLHKNLYVYRRHSGSLTEQRRMQVLQAREQAIRRNLPELGWASGKDKAGGYLHLAQLARERGDREQARSYWQQALRLSPYLTLRRAVRDVFGQKWGNRLSHVYVSLKQRLGAGD